MDTVKDAKESLVDLYPHNSCVQMQYAFEMHQICTIIICEIGNVPWWLEHE